MRTKVKHSLLTIVLATIFLISCSSSDEESLTPPTIEGVSVKTMTYNIYSGQKKGIAAIAEVINKADPDIVGLQEVESKSTKVPEDVIQALLAATSMQYYWFAKAYDVNGGEYGNLILSKYPLSGGVTYDLGVIITTGSYPRSLGVVQVEKDGKQFYFANTHLDHLSDVTNKMHQVEQIILHTKQLDKPVILSGDFNAVEGSDPYNALIQQFTSGCLDGNCGLTTGTPVPVKAIDFLMYAPKEAVTPVEYSVFYDAFSESDHFPVVATFNIHK
jgi:endonuclease/exonuclease/phosphatase family metal-dependent hydrolase